VKASAIFLRSSFLFDSDLSCGKKVEVAKQELKEPVLRLAMSDFHPVKWLAQLLLKCFAFLKNVALGFVADPIQGIMQLLVILVLLAVLWLIRFHWDRVCYLFTGDANLHVDHLAILNHVSGLVCCGSGCCGWNPCRRIRQWVGLEAFLVKVSDLVVGDLPTLGHGDYFVHIALQTAPPLSTSVAERQLPKVVQFPETLFLRLRYAPTEYDVIFTVRKHLPIGHEDVCRARFPADIIFKACGTYTRFEMQPIGGYTTDTPPWICIRFSYASNPREVSVEGVHADEFTAYCSCMKTGLVADEEGDLKTVQDFKDSLPLHTTSLIQREPGAELSEDQLGWMFFCRSCYEMAMWVLIQIWLWVTIALGTFRFLVHTCHEDYKSITTVHLGESYWTNMTYPLSLDDYHSIESTCNELVPDCSALTADGKTNFDVKYCCPEASEILSTCSDPPLGYRPYFTRRVVDRLFSQDIGRQGMECPAWFCEASEWRLVKHDKIPFFFLLFVYIGLLLITKCVGPYARRKCGLAMTGKRSGSFTKRKSPKYDPVPPNDSANDPTTRPLITLCGF